MISIQSNLNGSEPGNECLLESHVAICDGGPVIGFNFQIERGTIRLISNFPSLLGAPLALVRMSASRSRGIPKAVRHMECELIERN
jgi:hypothetical protein